MVLEQDEWYFITSTQTPTRIVKIFEPIALPGAHSSLRDEIKCYPTYIEDGEIKKLDSNRTVYMAYDSVCTNYYKLDSLLKADKHLTAEQYHKVVTNLIRPEELLNEAMVEYQDAIEDATIAVDDAFLAVDVERIGNNASSDEFSIDYWNRISDAEARLESITKEKESAEEYWNNQIEDAEKVVAHLKKRIETIS